NRRRVPIHAARASTALCAVGRRAKRTNGSAPAASNGIRLIPAACALLAFTSRVKPIASRAEAGRCNERSLENAVTNLARNVWWAIGSATAGLLMQVFAFSLPLIAGGGANILNDLLLYRSFRALRLRQGKRTQKLKRAMAP